MTDVDNLIVRLKCNSYMNPKDTLVIISALKVAEALQYNDCEGYEVAVAKEEYSKCVGIENL